MAYKSTKKSALTRIRAGQVENTTTGCLEWVKFKCQDYGQLSYQGKTWYVHRLVYHLAFGEIPEGKDILHRCNNPACGNLEHLYAGTHQQNMKDRDRTGILRTSLLGNTNAKSILTKEDVVKIKTVYKGYSEKILADMYKVHVNTIRDIIFNRTWKHVIVDKKPPGSLELLIQELLLQKR